MVGGFQTIDWYVLTAYLAGMIGVGAWFARRQTSTREFFKADGTIHWTLAAFSVAATLFSGISFIGQPARVVSYDAALIAKTVSILLVTPVVMYVLLPFYRRLDVTTAYEYLEKRFSLNVRLFASTLFIAKRLCWMALVCVAPSLVLSTVTGLRVEYCILLIGSIATIYTTLGGIRAVIWTDAVQFLVLTLGQILIIWYVAARLDGGLAEIWKVSLVDQKWGSFDFDFSRLTLWTALIAGIFIALSDLGADQVTVQRWMTVTDEAAARKSLVFHALVKIPNFIILMGTGLALWAFYQAYPQLLTLERGDYDKIVPYFVVAELPVGISGVVIAALFAAAMSSFDSGLNSLVTAFTVDWYQRVIKIGRDDSEYLSLAKLLTLVVGIVVTIVALLIYYVGFVSIVDLSNKFLGFFGGALLGIFLLGVLTRRANPVPTLAGAFVSVVGVLLFDHYQESTGANILHFFMYSLVTCVTTMLIGYAGSVFGPELPPERIRDYTLAGNRGKGI